MSAVEIRAVGTLEEIDDLDALSASVTGAPDAERPPRELLRAMAAHTTPIFAAYDESACVGAVLGAWGREDGGTPFLWSWRLAVAATHRRRGVATRLKQAQRAHAAANGVDEIRWTFDPMRAGNARFNLAALGARGVAFHEDLYGERADTLNAGERTDRMLLRWIPGAQAPTTIVRRVEIPPDYDEYLARPVARRRAERDRVRDELLAAFDAGLHASGFEPPATYLLTEPTEGAR